MISYDTCHSLSDLIHSVQESLNPSMLLQVVLLHTFLCTARNLITGLMSHLEKLGYRHILTDLPLEFIHQCTHLISFFFFFFDHAAQLEGS